MRRLATLALIAACGRSAHAPPPAPSNTPAPTVVEPEPVALPAPPLGDEQPAPEEPPPPPSPPYLVGAWASACMPGATKGTSTQLTATITDTAWVLAVDAFRDPACRKHAAQLRTEGGYELVAPSSVVAGAWDARVDFAQRTLTVDDAATAKAMAKTCRLGARPPEAAGRRAGAWLSRPARPPRRDLRRRSRRRGAGGRRVAARRATA
ncbi:MAG: hypothetical protein IPH44_21345 [Myxococcales bacterium]|nr:hypothetical protein [Myxococcales bacterium]